MNRLQQLLDEICCQQCEVDPAVLETVIVLAVQIAREGREGRKVGTIFTIGDAEAVLAQSRCLILDPLYGHPEAARHVDDVNLRETVKELAQLDGGFVVSRSGVFLSAARYFNALAEGLDLPLGLGSRHIAAASVSRQTKALAIVVSESAVVRIFNGGELISEIIPELWMLRRQGYLLDGTPQIAEDVAVVSKE